MNFKDEDKVRLVNPNGEAGKWCIPDRFWGGCGTIVGVIYSKEFAYIPEGESFPCFNVKAYMIEHESGPW